MTSTGRPSDTYTHGHHESVLRSHRWRTAANSAGYLLPELRPGQHLLDVGAGPGTLTVDLAGHVHPGLVVGIDNAAEVLDAARDHAAAQGADTVTFAVGDVYALDFADARFDVVHAHQVLQHLTDPVAALREMRRVCRVGGTVAVRDSDYSAMTWHPADPRLTDWLDLYRAVARANGAEPDAGRRLLAWARAAGFTEVRPSASAWCFATPADRQWWGEVWADRVTGSAFARQAVDGGLATPGDLARLADGWRDWAGCDDGWFSVLHGELLATA